MHKQNVSIVLPEEDVKVKFGDSPRDQDQPPHATSADGPPQLHGETRARRDLGRRHQDDDRDRGETRRDAGILLQCLTRMSKI